MYEVYSFNFLDTVSKQLVSQLENIAISPLGLEELNGLSYFQENAETAQGIYVLHLDGTPVYLGKADNVFDRLKQHRRKLSGRQNIDLGRIGFKALLLDRSMGTAANEDLLIRIFMESHPDNWNGGGFGSKDPGQNRDNSTPNDFDKAYPIRANYPVTSVTEVETVASLFEKMKKELPYIFRYDLPGDLKGREVHLRGVHQVADELLQAGVDVMGDGWRGIILSFGMVVYRNDTKYQFAIREISPRPYAP